jgi:FkbH-like protein
MTSRLVPCWLPELVDRDATFAAIKASRPEDRLAAIVAASQHRLDFVQTGKLDRYLQSALAELPEPPGLQRIRLGWLGSSTLEHLLPAARIACLRRGLLLESYLAPYDQYRQELFDAESGLARFRPHVVLLCLDHEHVGVSASIDASAGDVAAQVQQRVAELRSLWRMAADRLGCTVIQQTIPNLAPQLFGSFDSAVPGAALSVIDQLNRALVSDAARAHVPVLDLASWAARLGHDAWFDPVRWFQAKQLVSPILAPMYGDLVARIVGAIRGRSRKCLVLDLDNTLWGGVVGDDGVDRLVLGYGSASGEAFAQFQRYARLLRSRGIVLAVCSKNDRAVAESAFANHPEMELRLDDFAVFVANWDDKASNLRRIADNLNLGLDSLVFFDDNPAERALVRAELPMVAVPEVPDDPAYFVRTLEDAGYFEAVSFTSEDVSRAQQYQDNGRRVQAMESATDMDSFLRSLSMVLTIGQVDAHSLPRVAQLINKTNQFNVTTRRYSEAELQALVEQPASIALYFRLADRFGDNGLIGVLLARAESPERHIVDTLLMSCRVLGRGVELAMMNALVERIRQRGARELLGEYLPTARNGMVADLYSRLGFEPVSRDEGCGATRWSLQLDRYVPHSTFITPHEATHDPTREAT